MERDSDDIAVSMKDQVQKAVDCYNAGATVLHVHVREPDGKGSKRLEMFNEMLDRLRTAVPKMMGEVIGGGIWAIIQHAINTGELEDLPSLAPQIAEFTVTPLGG